MADASGQEFGEVRSGDHVLLIYDDSAALTAFAVPFIKKGLTKGERCLYIVDDLTLLEVTRALAAGGVDVEREIERGSLVLLNAQGFYTLPGFDALGFLELTRRRVREASAHRFAGLRIAAEMTWALKMGISDDDLVEYESLLDDAFSGLGPLIIACMYPRTGFAPAILRQLVRNHAKVVAGDHVYVSLSALFQNLARSDLQGLLQSADERRVPKGGFYFHQGDQASELFVLTSGRVKLVQTDPHGRNVILAIAVPTDPFGDRAALAGTTRQASAQALEDSRALVWDVPTILQAMVHHPAISLNAVRLMAELAGEKEERIQELVSSRVERRLARLLLRLAQSLGRKTPSGVIIDLQVSGQDLAELASTTPYTVSRLMAGWRRLNIVDAQRERILILDQQRIADIAGVRGSEGLSKVDVGRPAPPVH